MDVYHLRKNMQNLEGSDNIISSEKKHGIIKLCDVLKNLFSDIFLSIFEIVILNSVNNMTKAN